MCCDALVCGGRHVMIGVYRFSGTGHAAAVADFLGEQLGVP